MEENIKILAVKFILPEDCQIICGQAHFHLLSIEDLYRAVAVGAPAAKFGIAFSEASGACLIRKTGNDPELIEIAIKNLEMLMAGHYFVIILKEAFPIQVLNNIKNLNSVVTIHVATGNPSIAIIARINDSAAVLGVADGESPKGIESEKESSARQALIRKIGYLEPHKKPN